MIKSTNLLVLDKTDIARQPHGIEKSFVNLSITDLRNKSRELLSKSDMVVVNDEKGNTNVLKNRWGKNGIVVSYQDYTEFLKFKNENNKLNSTPKKKHLLGRIFKNFWPFN